MKFLFKNFLKDKDIYSENVEYWNNQFNHILKGIPFEKYFNTTFANGEDFFDGNPIYNFKLKNSERAIFIIQEEPISKDVYFKAWIDKFDTEENTVEKLVIVLELSEQSENITMELIKNWIINQYRNEDIEREIELLMNPISKNIEKNIFSDVFVFENNMVFSSNQISPSIPECKNSFQKRKIKLHELLNV